MRIEDIQEMSDGKRLLAGVNAELDELSIQDIQKAIGSEIWAKCDNDEMRFKVADVRSTIAFTGRKNIFIMVEDPSIRIYIGCNVYAKQGLR